MNRVFPISWVRKSVTKSPLAPSSQPWTWCQLWFTFLFIPRSAQAAMLQAAGRPLQHLHPMTLGRTPGHISLAIHHITIIIVSTLDESRNTLTPLTVPCVHSSRVWNLEILHEKCCLYCRADRPYIGLYYTVLYCTAGQTGHILGRSALCIRAL